MKAIFISLCLVLLFSGIAKAQEGFDKDYDSLPKYSGIFEDMRDFIPWNNGGGEYVFNNQPIKTIKLSFHSILRGDSTGNFTQADTVRFKNIVNLINQKFTYSFPSDPIPGYPQLPDYDTKIRFTLDNASENCNFYPSNYYYTNFKGASTLHDYAIDINPNSARRYNVYFTPYYTWPYIKKITVTNSGTGYTSAPQVVLSPPFENIGATAYVSNGKVDSIILDSEYGYNVGGDFPINPVVTITGGGGTGAVATLVWSSADGECHSDLGISIYRKYNASDASIANLLAHELGHSLGLGHVLNDEFNNCNCNLLDFLEDVYGMPAPGNCPHERSWGHNVWENANDKYTNNLMTYGPELTYLSPMQTGIAHRATCSGYIRYYVKPELMDYDYIVNSGAYNYDNAVFYADIILNAGWTFDKKEGKPAPVFTLIDGGVLEINSFLRLFNQSKIDGLFGGGVNSNIVVKNQGELMFENAQLHLSGNSILLVKAGGKLNLSNSKIYLYDDAKIIFEQDGGNTGLLNINNECHIITENQENIIFLDGKLKFSYSCKLIFSGSGCFEFNGVVENPTSQNSNEAVSFEGIGNEFTMLKIKNNNFVINSKYLTLKNGKVELGTNSLIKLEKNKPYINIENVIFTSNGTQKYSQALNIANPLEFNIVNCTFEHGSTAISVLNLATHPAINLQSCTFNDFRTGISVNGGAIAMDGCSFTNCTTGLFTSNMTNANSILNCLFDGLTTGINFKGLTSSSLAVSYSNVSSNTDGLMVEGPVLVATDCSDFTSNTISGIYLKNHASLDANNCNFDNSKYPVLASQAHNFDLHNGYNTLKCSSGGLAMSGSFCGTPYLTVDAFRNRWNSLGIAPRQTTDYNLKDCNTTPLTITLRDLYPQNSYTECGVPGGLMGAQAFAATGSGFPIELENKISEAANLMEINNPQGNDQLAFEKLYKIVTTPKYYQTENQRALVDKAYAYLRQTLGNLANHQPAVLEVHATKTLQAAQFVQSKNPGNYRVKFNTHIDRSHVKLLEGKFGQAIQILSQMQSWTLEADEAYRAKELCLAQQMKALAEGTLTTDDPEALMLECNCYEPAGDGNEGAEENGDNINNMLTINVLPNPTTGNATIEILLPENSAGAVLTIHDQMGILKQQFSLQAGQNTLATGKSILGTGVFNLGVFLNGTKIGEGRLSVND